MEYFRPQGIRGFKVRAMEPIPTQNEMGMGGGKIPHQKFKVGDLEFDSMAEHDRYIELKVMQKAGRITDLECHPSYEILPKQETPPGKQNFRAVVYTPDFRYRKADGTEVVEEVKSEYTRKEKDYIIRRKLILYTLGIYVEEVIR